jgi:hypothetical protein
MTRCPDCPLKYMRSKEAHSRLFVVVEEAFKHWPADNDFQPSDKEHLRYWLEKEAGLYDVALTYRPDKMKAADIAVLLETMLKAIAMANPKIDAKNKVFIEPTVGLKGRTQVVVKVTRSIAWRSLAADDFNALSAAVYEVLAAHGLNHDQLLAEKDKAA